MQRISITMNASKFSRLQAAVLDLARLSGADGRATANGVRLALRDDADDAALIEEIHRLAKQHRVPVEVRVREPKAEYRNTVSKSGPS